MDLIITVGLLLHIMTLWGLIGLKRYIDKLKG